MSASKTTTAGTTVPCDQEPQTGMAFREDKGNQKIIINIDKSQKNVRRKNMMVS